MTVAELLAAKQVRFLIVGGWNTLFGWLAFTGIFLATRPIGLHYMAVLVIGHVLAVTNAYLGYRLFVFGREAPVRRSAPRFLMVQMSTFGFNAIALPLLVQGAGLWPPLAQGLLVALTAVVGYLFHDRFSFRA